MRQSDCKVIVEIRAISRQFLKKNSNVIELALIDIKT